MSLKSLREDLARHQSDPEDWPADVATTVRALIGVLDQHRPIGADGTHGSLHTGTCGCEGTACLLPCPCVKHETRPLWLVTRKGVYDHGVCYVGLTEADAQRFVQEYAPDKDGYHSWRIDSIVVGVPTEDSIKRPLLRCGKETD